MNAVDSVIRTAIRGQALSLFAQRGVDAVSVAEICREADVANGSFYNFYRSKDALIADLLNEAQAALAGALAAAQREPTTPEEAHRRDVTIIVTFVENNLNLFKLALATHARPGMTLSLIDGFARQRREEIGRAVAEGLFRPDLDPTIAAYAEVGLTVETMSWWVRNPGAVTREALIDQLTAIRTRITNGAVAT